MKDTISTENRDRLVKERTPIEILEVPSSLLPSDLQLPVADELALRNRAIEFLNDPQNNPHYLQGRDWMSLSDREAAECWVYLKMQCLQASRILTERWKRLRKSEDLEVSRNQPPKQSTKQKVKAEADASLNKKLNSGDKEYKKYFRMATMEHGLNAGLAIKMSKAELKDWLKKAMKI